MPDASARLAELLRPGVAVAATIDATGFFNQFELGDVAATNFAFRGPAGQWIMPTVLPMGFRLSPAIAQRVLLLLLSRAGLTSSSMVWVDNVLLVASSTPALQLKLARFSAVAAEVGLDWKLEAQGPQVDYLGATLNVPQRTFTCQGLLPAEAPEPGGPCPR